MFATFTIFKLTLKAQRLQVIGTPVAVARPLVAVARPLVAHVSAAMATSARWCIATSIHVGVAREWCARLALTHLTRSMKRILWCRMRRHRKRLTATHWRQWR